MMSKADQFEALLKTHERVLFKVASLYAARAEDRRDLVQEIRVQLWRAFSSYDETRSFSTWMYRIALNVAISSVRKQKTAPSSLENVQIAVPFSAPDERIQFLQQFMARLDEINRALLALYLEEHSYAEISEILGISETNVATKISRLKQKIRKEHEDGTR
jgi:RNA polymerase sigma factor (sigma-70 family)